MWRFVSQVFFLLKSELELYIVPCDLYGCIAHPNSGVHKRFRATYCGQDVAVKVLRSENLNKTLEDEFAHEADILRYVIL